MPEPSPDNVQFLAYAALGLACVGLVGITAATYYFHKSGDKLMEQLNALLPKRKANIISFDDARKRLRK